MSTIVAAANKVAASRSTPQANIGKDKQPKLNMYNVNNVAAVDIYDKRPPCRDGEESSYSDCNCNEERSYIKNDADDTNTNSFCKNSSNKNGTFAEQTNVAENMHNKMKRHVRLSECRLPEMEKSNVYTINEYTTSPSDATNVSILPQQQLLLENGKYVSLLETAKQTMPNRFSLPSHIHSNVNNNSINQKHSDKNDDDSVCEYQESLLREINLLRANPEQYIKFIEQECTLGCPFVECLHDLYIDSDVNADVIEYMRSMIVKSQNDQMHYNSTCHEPEVNLHPNAASKSNGNKFTLSPHDSGLSSDMANSSSNTNNEWVTRHVPEANRKRQSTCDETKKKNVKEKKAHKRSSAVPNALSASPLALFDGAVNADSKTRLSYLTNAKGEVFSPNVFSEGDAIEQHVHYIVEMNEGTLSDHGLCELTREQLKVQYKRHCTRFNSLSKVIKLINEQHALHVQQSELEEQHQQEEQQQQQQREESKKDERAAKRLCTTTPATATATTPSTSVMGVNNTLSTTSNNNNVNSNSILTSTQSKKSNSSSTNKNIKTLESKRGTTEIKSNANSNTRMEGDESKRFAITVPASMTAVINEQSENATLQADSQQYKTSTTNKSNFDAKMQILCKMLVQCKATCERMQRGLVLFAHVLQMLREIHYPLPPLTINTGLMLTSQAIMRELSVRSNRTLTHEHHDENVNALTSTNSPLTCNLTPQLNTLHNDPHNESDISVTSELVLEACSNYGYPSGILSVLCMTDHTSSVTLTPRAVVMRSLLCTHMAHAFHIAENNHTNSTPSSQEKLYEENTRRKEKKYSNDVQNINDDNSNKHSETNEENIVQTVHPLLMPHNRLFGCGWVRRMCHNNWDNNNSSPVGNTIVFLMITSSGFEELRLIHSFPTYNVDALNRIVMERKCNAMTSKHEWENFNSTTENININKNNNLNTYSNKTNEMSKYYSGSNNKISMDNSGRKYQNDYDNTFWPQNKLTNTCSCTLPSILPISLSRPFTSHGLELNFAEHGASVTQSYCTKALNANKFDTEANAIMRYIENKTSSASETLCTAVIDIHSSFGIRLLYPIEHPMHVDLRENVACIILDCTSRSTLMHDCNIKSNNEKNEKINNGLEEKALSLNNIEITATVTARSELSSMSLSSPLHNSRLTLVQPSTVDDNITTILINTQAVFEEFKEEHSDMYSKDSNAEESVEVKVHLFERLRNANVNYSSLSNCTSTNMQHMSQIELTKTNEFRGTDNTSDRLFTISGFHHIGFVRICITNNNNNNGNTYALQSIPTALRPHIEYLKVMQPNMTPHLFSYINEQSNFRSNHYSNSNNTNKSSFISDYKNNNNRCSEFGWPEVSLSFHNYHATLLAPLSHIITVTPGNTQIYFALCLPISHADKTQNVYTVRKTMELRKLLMDLYLEQEADNLIIPHNQNHTYNILINNNSSNSNKRESKENMEWNVPTQSDTTAQILTINNNNNNDDSTDNFSGDVKNVNNNADSTIVLIDKTIKMASTKKPEEMTQIESTNIIDMSLEKETTRDGAVSAKNKEEANNDNANQNNNDVKKVNRSDKKEAAQNTVMSNNNNSSRKEVKKKSKQAKKEKQQELSKENNNRNEILVEVFDQNKHENLSTHGTSVNDKTSTTRANQTKQTDIINKSKMHSKESAEMISNMDSKEQEQESLFDLPLSEEQEKLLISTNASCSLAQVRAVLAELRKMESDWSNRLDRAETWLNEELLDFDVTHESVMNNSRTSSSGGGGSKKNSFYQRSARGNVAKKKNNNKMANSTSSDLVNNHFSDSTNEQANELCSREDHSDGNRGNANMNNYSNSSITSINSSGSINAKNNHGVVTVTATDKLAKGKKNNAHAGNIIVVKGTSNQPNNNNNTNSSVKKIKGKELLKWQTNRENMRCKLVHMKESVNQLRSKIAHVRVLLLQKERTSLIRSDKIMRLEKELSDLSQLDSPKDKTTNQHHLHHSQNVPNYPLLEEQHCEQEEQCNVELWLCTTSTQWTPSKLCQMNSISEGKEQSESVHSPIKIAQLHCCQWTKPINVVNNAQFYDGQCTLPTNVHGTLRMTVNGEELVRWQVR